MNETILVFLAGTVLSFPVVLWFLMKPAKRKRPAKGHARATQMPLPDQSFQIILKKESFDRAVKAIGAIQTELDLQLRMAGRAGLSPHTNDVALAISPDHKRQLEECIDLVETLFSEEASNLFKSAVTRLAEIDRSQKLGQSTRYATTAIGTLRNELEAKEHRPVPPRPRPQLSQVGQVGHALQLGHEPALLKQSA